MNRIPLSSLPRKQLEQLHNSKCHPPMYITVDPGKYDENIGAALYDIHIGIQCGHDVVQKTIRTRFSELDKLNNQINSEIKTNLRFPEKKWFGSTNSAFIEKRSKDLATYMGDLTKIPGILKLKSVQSFFHI